MTEQGTLHFNEEYNNTNIQCRATFSNGETEDSNNFTLLVQGKIIMFLLSCCQPYRKPLKDTYYNCYEISRGGWALYSIKNVVHLS